MRCRSPAPSFATQAAHGKPRTPRPHTQSVPFYCSSIPDCFRVPSAVPHPSPPPPLWRRAGPGALATSLCSPLVPCASPPLFSPVPAFFSLLPRPHPPHRRRPCLFCLRPCSHLSRSHPQCASLGLPTPTGQLGELLCNRTLVTGASCSEHQQAAIALLLPMHVQMALHTQQGTTANMSG